MGKISVTHYVNTKLKAKNHDGNECFPVYIRVIHKRILSRIKSTFIYLPTTEADLKNAEIIQRLCRHETQFIKSFFEYAEKQILDFSVDKSKCNLGKLLEFYGSNFWELLRESIFIDFDMRNEIRDKIVNYLAKKSGLNDNTIQDIIPQATLDLPFILSRETIRELTEKQILSNNEAMALEFILMATDYTDTNRGLMQELMTHKDQETHTGAQYYVHDEDLGTFSMNPIADFNIKFYDLEKEFEKPKFVEFLKDNSIFIKNDAETLLDEAIKAVNEMFRELYYNGMIDI
ncbi:MAG: hypothetical protein FWD09_03765 [Lentimicrobiaceae bacterium]|nr:hypothetical protein [Lentimicrobiaceae bacterium]